LVFPSTVKHHYCFSIHIIAVMDILSWDENDILHSYYHEHWQRVRLNGQTDCRSDVNKGSHRERVISVTAYLPRSHLLHMPTD